MDKEAIIDDIILRYLDGEATPQEQQQLLRWTKQSDANSRRFQHMKDMWQVAGDNAVRSRFDKDKAYKVFSQRVAAATTHAARGAKIKSIKPLYRAAAVVILFLTASLVSYFMGGAGITRHFDDIVVEAPFGSRTVVRLPDGSRVWLNSGTRLAYSQGFGVESRTVNISGQGYFEVAHNAEKPFTVVSEGMSVKVLGTKFDYCDYPGESSAVVTLAQGSVAVKSVKGTAGDFTLKPDERAVVNKTTGGIQIESCYAADVTAWTGGTIVMDGQTLESVAAVLQRSYNVHIVFANPRSCHLRFYGTFLRQEQSIGEVMEALKATGKMTYRRDGDTITIY